MSSRVLVNLGCGTVWHDAWLNYDLDPQDPAIRAIDLDQALPFPDGTVDALYHAHVLEHLAPRTGERLLAECFRVLKPGGVIRVVVPDLEQLARHYLAALAGEDELAYEWAVLELLDQMVRIKNEGAMGDFLRTRPWSAHPEIRARVGTEIGAARPAPAVKKRYRRPARAWARLRFALAGFCLNRREAGILREARFRASGEIHRWMYDRVSLARLLRATGFSDPTQRSATDSGIAGFGDCELDTNSAGRARHPDSLYMEAGKPA